MDENIIKLMEKIENTYYSWAELKGFCESIGLDPQYAWDILMDKKIPLMYERVFRIDQTHSESKFRLNRDGLRILEEHRRLKSYEDIQKENQEIQKENLKLQKSVKKSQWIIVVITIIGLIASSWLSYRANILEEETRYPQFKISLLCGEPREDGVNISFRVDNLGEFADVVHTVLTTDNKTFLDNLSSPDSDQVINRLPNQDSVVFNSPIIDNYWRRELDIKFPRNISHSAIFNFKFTCDSIQKPCKFIGGSEGSCIYNYENSRLLSSNTCVYWK